MKNRDHLLEEEFDDTEIESPLKSINSNDQHKQNNDFTSKSFSNFRSNINVSEEKSPINRLNNESNLNKTYRSNLGINQSIVKSPPSLKFDKINAIDMKSFLSEQEVNDVPITTKYNRKRRNDSKSLDLNKSTTSFESVNKVSKPILKKVKDYSKNSNEHQNTPKQSILDKVNSTLDSLQKAKTPLATTGLFSKAKNASKFEDEPDFDSNFEPKNFNQCYEKKPLDISTPIINNKSNSSPIAFDAWWPTSKWLKLERVINSDSINREDAINSLLLMKELGCTNKEELQSRYDFLQHYRSRTRLPKMDL
ncbi:hypothetical protein KGF54_000777 [Candida jiufengensis]|uniref:uncharacterized protein n=1 Tax=Candida jiufengensis TaxID=497108 RepID=UPI002224CA1D|nr:uncharacterized protein KGF54_000777 [Candida jiufengensis]KAI5956302.1 hypothetical protein KGF54_000777 [Candida jiufengensis]